MSEKPQHEPDVSRETSVDLNEILDRAMPHIPDPPAEQAEEESPVQEENAPQAEEEASPPPPQRNKRSSVYVYLAVMFAAAFLMLLLAYFVQQRNNETAMDDLRSTSTASRQELLEQIDELEKENESLQQDNELLNLRLEQVKEEREALKQQVDDYYYSTSESHFRTAFANTLDYLERFINERDWLMAGAAIESMDSWFNDHNVEYWGGSKIQPTPSQTARYFELREEVFDKGRCMTVDRTYTTEDQSEYTEQPKITEGVFAEEDYETAKNLFTAMLYYPDSLDIPAGYLFEYFRVTASSLDRVNSGAFKPSTVELYQQIRADVLAAGELMERNGELAGVSRETQED